MKTIVSALIALSVLAGVAAPASALDAKTFYEQQDAAYDVGNRTRSHCRRDPKQPRVGGQP